MIIITCSVRNYYIYLILVILSLTFSSCATMFNAKWTNVTIVTSKPSKVVLDGDTLRYSGTKKYITVDRNDKPLNITAFNDSLTKTVVVKEINSVAYWLNAYPSMHFWTGFRIDTRTKRRYTYPHTVYIDLAQKDSTYLTYQPLDKKDNKYSNILKFTPLKMFGLVNPSFELSYERRTGPGFSTQVMASYLMSNSVWEFGGGLKPDIKGYRFAIEEKFYFKKSAPLGQYISFEVNYLKNQYQDIGTFGPKHSISDTTHTFTDYSDTLRIKKHTFSFNFKYGYQIIMERFSVDFSAGLGLRYKDVEQFDRINPNDVMISPKNPSAAFIRYEPGKYWTVSIPITVRMGWRF